MRAKITGPVYSIGDRVAWEGKPGTVTETRIIRSTSALQPLPPYQRATVRLDPNPEGIWQAEGASRQFDPLP
jgi:hypothetical protein